MKYLVILLLITGLQADIKLDERLISTLIQVESNGNNEAIGDNGKAYGCLQIWSIVVRDVNRVYHTKYTHKQMFDRYTSCEVTELYLMYWGKHYEKKTGKKATNEILARIHNGGPQGYKKEATKKYWKKVLDILK